MSFATMRRLQAEAAQLQAQAFRLEARAAMEWFPNKTHARNLERLAVVYDRMAAEHLNSAAADDARTILQYNQGVNAA